jgi:hypothetical protein
MRASVIGSGMSVRMSRSSTASTYGSPARSRASAHTASGGASIASPPISASPSPRSTLPCSSSSPGSGDDHGGREAVLVERPLHIVVDLLEALLRELEAVRVLIQAKEQLTQGGLGVHTRHALQPEVQRGAGAEALAAAGHVGSPRSDSQRSSMNFEVSGV